MTNLRKIETELREAAEVGCDYTLLEEAADALNYAIKLIDFYANGGKTVYVKMQCFSTQDELEAIERDLNARSPDKIVVLPSFIDIINKEDLDEIEVKKSGE